MQKYFLASLCKNGILGGGITLEPDSFTYHTNKSVIPNEYRKLQIPFRDIRSLSTGRTLLFPWISVSLTSGEEYKFIIFSRKRFLELLRSQGVDC